MQLFPDQPTKKGLYGRILFFSFALIVLIAIPATVVLRRTINALPAATCPALCKLNGYPRPYVFTVLVKPNSTEIKSFSAEAEDPSGKYFPLSNSTIPCFFPCATSKEHPKGSKRTGDNASFKKTSGRGTTSKLPVVLLVIWMVACLGTYAYLMKRSLGGLQHLKNEDGRADSGGSHGTSQDGRREGSFFAGEAANASGYIAPEARERESRERAGRGERNQRSERRASYEGYSTMI